MSTPAPDMRLLARLRDPELALILKHLGPGSIVLLQHAINQLRGRGIVNETGVLDEATIVAANQTAADPLVARVLALASGGTQ